MKIWTAQELIDKVERELDMSDETFIATAQEKYDYLNEGVLYLERIIHTLHLDYFKKQYFFPLVAGTSRYNPPADQYANYGIKMFWLDGGQLSPAVGGNNYEVVRVKLMQIPLIEIDEDYMYDTENVSAAVGMQYVFYPPPRETTSLKLMMFYIRQANRITIGTDKMDIPEGELFMFSWLRKLYLSKDKGNPQYEEEVGRLQNEEANFRATMASMAPASVDGVIEGDYEWYEELY